VIKQDFWPINDEVAMSLINDILKIDEKRVSMLSADIHWLPRLMQTYSGYIDVYETNDAFIHILIANLAGTTLQNT